MNANSGPAILIFSRSAREEADIKQYGSTLSKNKKVALQLIRHTEREARFSGLPIIRKYGNAQVGQCFGSRFAHAIQEVFDLGYSEVIALGTDSPGISTALIRKIAQGLKIGEIVTGPSIDGGVYAVGISKTSWNKSAFEEIPWQTSAVQQGISEYASSLNCEQIVLHQLQDVDDKQSFLSWLSSAEKSVHLGQSLRSIIARIKQHNETGTIIVPICHSPSIARRGPPKAA